MVQSVDLDQANILELLNDQVESFMMQMVPYMYSGLYDPILDDSEEICLPVGPNDLDQGTNIHELRQGQIESNESYNTKIETEYSILDTSKPYRPCSAGTLEEPLKLNHNCKDVFPEICLDKIPLEIKYKLPVSEQYDPEGKRVKEKAAYDKNIIVDFEQIKKLAEQYNAKQTKKISLKDDFINKSLFEKKENIEVHTDEYKFLHVSEEECELDQMKHTDTQVKEKLVHDKNVLVDFEKIKKLADQYHAKQTKEKSFNKDVVDKSLFEKKENLQASKNEYKHLNVLEEEIELRKIKQTAKQVIEDSLSKAVSVANQFKNKSEYKSSEPLYYEENKISLSKQSVQQSNRDKVKLTKKVSFEDIKEYELDMTSEEVSKREVRVADEIKKFETFDIQMDSKVNEEERKLLTRRDIEEAIEVGTVRQRTGMFKTGTDKIVADKLDQKLFETVKSEVKTNLELAKQRVYDIGLQIIPRLRATVKSSRQSTMLLKRFILQMINVMIKLHKFIPVEKRYKFTKSKQIIEEVFRRDTFINGTEEIKKPKLSGAKIAQIEGLKPAELTDRMNVVISEFLRKSGKEEIFDSNERRAQEECLNDTSFSEKAFDDSQTGDIFLYGSSFNKNTYDKSNGGNEFSDSTHFRGKSYDNRKLFEEMYETKTKSYEMREIKEEKRYSESKTSKYDSKVHSYETESATRDDVSVPLTYIAIVEAHVYTNKNAIFEEQMRRMSESIKQSDLTETGIIYYRCEVSVFYRQFREPSLPPTVVIESIEEVPSEQVFEEESQELLQTCETGYEDTAKKLAVQKISEVIEPLLQIKEVKSVNIKQAYPSFETPLKLISEQTTISMEKEENILLESKLIAKSHISIEEPVKSVVATSEIKDEEKSEFVEIIEIEERKPRSILEPSQAIAETTEIFIEEETIGMVDIPQPIAQLPQPVKIERAIKTVAETSEVIVDDANIEILEVSNTISATPQYTFMEKSLLVSPETTVTSTEEPVCEELIITKAHSKEAKVDMSAKVVAEITEISLSEREQQTFDLIKITVKEPGALKEESMLSVGETQTITPFEPSAELFDSKKVIYQQSSITIEESKATETTFIQVEEPKLTFEINENLQQEAHVEIEELKTATVSSVTVEEPKQETVETHKVRNKEANTDMEASLLMVAENIIILPEGPYHGNLEIPQLETKRPKTLIEGGLIVAETTLVSPTSLEGDFILIENQNQQANIRIEESKAITTSLVHLEEPKEQKLDVLPLLKKQPQALLQDTLLPVAITLELLPEGPKDDSLVTSKTIHGQAEIEIEEFKASASVAFVSVEEPRNKSLERFSYKEKELESSFEKPVLNVAEKFDIIQEGPLYDNLETPAIKSGTANILIEEIKPLTVSIITPNEPQEKAVLVPKVKDMKPQFLVEDSYLPVVEATSVVPDESKDRFAVVSVKSEKADVKIGELKGTSITVVYSEEPKEEDFKLPLIEAKQQQPVLETVHLTAAETSLILPEESKITFDVTKIPSQLARMEVIEQKAAEAFLVFPLDSRDKDLVIEEIIKKTPKTLVESPLLTASVNSIIISEEKVEEIKETTKLAGQKATVHLEGLKLPDTIIIFSEEPSPVGIEVAKLDKKEPQLTVEQTLKPVAVINLLQINELRNEITVDIKDTDTLTSSASSTISSAPSSPFIQEYVFGVFDVSTGHEYRVQSPQETELHIVQPARDQYGVDCANTSYTLTFEAKYEEEEEVLHMEEFSDVVKKNEFWISDIKTMETVESSDARIHLKDVTVGIQARKASQKHVSIQDSTVGIKSRSQSFDTSADYELSLQSSEQSEVRETQFSDVQAVATIDLKSKGSFKTMEDVESQAKVNIKSKAAKAYSAQSVDVAYGLTFENEIVVDGQSIELDVQSSMESKTATAKSSKRKVKKGTKSMALEKSVTGIEASYDYEAGMSVESRSISQESYAAMEKGIAKKSYAAMKGSLESRSIAEGSYATMEAEFESSKITEASYSANLESSNISESKYAAVEASLKASAISEASYSSKQARLESATSRSMGIDARQKITHQGLTEITQVDTMDKQKLSLKTDLKETKAQVRNGVKSPSPEDIPTTPLRDVYIFRLHTRTPEETTFIPRDCSFTPESVHEDEMVIVNGMIPRIDTKIVSVLYSPPLETPPTSPVRKVEPVFTKPGLRGGSETPEFLKPGSKSGSRTPEFTKEEILEIGRKSALLASEIDRTIRSIEEYKESVGIGTKENVAKTKEIEETTATEPVGNKVEKENNTLTKGKSLIDKTKDNDLVHKGKEKSELDARKANNKSRKSILSRFSQF